MTARVALTEIQNVAIHESGHATVAAHLGLPVQRIALWVKPVWVRGVVDYLRGDNASLDNLADHLAVLTAGHAAENLDNPACTFEHFIYGTDWLGDLQQAHLGMDWLQSAPSVQGRRNILKGQWDRSREILRTRFGGVIALANALLATYTAAEQRYRLPNTC